MSKETKKQGKAVSQNSDKGPLRQWIVRHKVKIIGAVMVLVLEDAFITGYVKFTYNVVRCGGVPVAINPGSSFASGYASSYTLPGDARYNISANKRYVCTEQEAKDMNITIDLFSEKGNEFYRNR